MIQNPNDPEFGVGTNYENPCDPELTVGRNWEYSSSEEHIGSSAWRPGRRCCKVVCWGIAVLGAVVVIAFLVGASRDEDCADSARERRRLSGSRLRVPVDSKKAEAKTSALVVKALVMSRCQ